MTRYGRSTLPSAAPCTKITRSGNHFFPPFSLWTSFERLNHWSCRILSLSYRILSPSDWTKTEKKTKRKTKAIRTEGKMNKSRGKRRYIYRPKSPPPLAYSFSKIWWWWWWWYIVRYDGYDVETATQAKVCMNKKQEPRDVGEREKMECTNETDLPHFPLSLLPFFFFLLFDFFLRESFACRTLNRLPRSNDNANSSHQPNSPSMKNSAFMNACKEMRKW